MGSESNIVVQAFARVQEINTFQGRLLFLIIICSLNLLF